MQLRTYDGNVPQCDAFFKEYKVQEIYIAPKDQKKRAKRKKRTEMICRFCKNKYGEATFASKPHIISRLFGNNAGISDFECDKCNNHFSKFETSTADFLGVNRSIYSLGKEKIPTFKAPDGSIEARSSEIYGHEAVEISAKMPGLISSISDTGKIEMEFKSNSYIPLNVYKSLLKIALTIMPESEFTYYTLLLSFLMEDKNSLHFACHATQVFRCQVGGEVATPYAIIFKKIKPDSDLPTHIFQLYYQDSCLQLHLPYRSGDKQLGELKELVIPMCPPFVVTSEALHGRANYEVLDLSSSEKKKGEVRKMYLEFDKNQIQKDIPVDIDKGELANIKFDPDTIVTVLFAREDPRNKS
ncbi:HNH endonuclease [Pedobacter panaciterrae]|uniref:HNH endonuclease n=1 Tax=Pedobacter panaciterrae TaxID=363849 RepID=UPI00259964A5|nr:HNH endonuclease [uncultured Pedobacter sp.]